MIAALTAAAERLPLPDAAIRAGIRALVARTDARLSAEGAQAEAAFARSMASRPVAEHVLAANAQHYEVPAAFFGHCLGPHRKYSCCFFAGPDTTLAQAERAALDETCAHAGLADGMRVLELGCGWGALSLHMAEQFPASHVTALSNSVSQRAHIEAEAASRGLGNLTVVTADMNDVSPRGRFDRIVSVEMFEHMANWAALLTRLRAALEPDGRLFLHVFGHASAPYRFDARDPADWIGRHFFTGGLMPSHGLLARVSPGYEIERDWRWSGHHYARTAGRWLERFDANREAIRPILAATYGSEAGLWERRWRLFFLAVEELFGFREGSRWGVSHYRLRLSR